MGEPTIEVVKAARSIGATGVHIAADFTFKGGKRDADANFVAWQAGRTGYPIVDAGMRQLTATG